MLTFVANESRIAAARTVLGGTSAVHAGTLVDAPRPEVAYRAVFFAVLPRPSRRALARAVCALTSAVMLTRTGTQTVLSKTAIWTSFVAEASRESRRAIALAGDPVASTPSTLAALLAVDAVGTLLALLIAALALQTGGTNAVSTFVMASDSSGTVAPQLAALSEPSLLASLFAAATNFS